MNDLLLEVRLAFRSLAKRPGFTLAAVITLALGIGANTAVMSFVDRALVRDLSIPAPGRLVQIVADRGADGVNHQHSAGRYVALRDGAEMLEGIAATSPIGLALSANGTELIEGAVVSENFFDVLGVRVTGRGFRPDEAAVSGGRVAVLSHRLWRTRFGGDPGLLGRDIVLSGRPFTVIGIAPEAFDGVVRGQVTPLWIPLSAYADLTGQGEDLTTPTISWLTLLGRLENDATLAQAEDRLVRFGRGLQTDGLLGQGERLALLPASGGLDFLVSAFETPVRLLGLLVALVLLIACANVANLLLARATGRVREVAVRASLGASRARLVRQLLTESLVLWVMGGLAALVVATWLLDLLAGFRPPFGNVLELRTGLDGRMLAIAGFATVATGLIFGLFPALRATRLDLQAALKEGGAASPGSGRVGPRGALVIAQVGLSLALLVTAGLLLRSLDRLRAVDPGFEARGVALASLDLEPLAYDRERGLTFYQELLGQLRSAPGVEGAALASTITPNPGGSRWDGVALEGITQDPDSPIGFDVNVVSPGYFETLGIRVLRGRSFGDQDRWGIPRVALVNETMARYWPDGNPIGRHIYAGEDSTAPAFEIVGVVRDGKYRSLRESGRAYVYYSAFQVYRSGLTVVARTRGDPAALLSLMRRQVAALDPNLPLSDPRTLEQHVARAFDQERLLALLAAVFGGLALLLAAVGLYGVMAFDVGRRTREIGIRMAVGARVGDVTGLVLARGVRLIGLGLLAGLAGGVALGRVASRMLFEVRAGDPATFLAAAALLTGIALFACWLPARRAARVDPIMALRSE